MVVDPPSPKGRSLTRDRIVTAALDLVAQVGVERLTMRDLGRALGVDPMAAYRHFANKDALCDAIVARLWQDALAAAPAGSDGQEVVQASMSALRDTLRRHPGSADLVLSRPLASPELLAFADRALARLEEAGLPLAPDTLTLLNAATVFTTGHVRLEESLASGRSGGEDRPEPGAHPAYERAVDGFVFDADAQFTRGLRSLLHGWSMSTL